MPIEFGYVPDGQTKEIGTYLLEPGEGKLLEDFSEGELRYIAIGCFEDDHGGEVKILPNDGSIADSEDDVNIDDFPRPIAVIDINEKVGHRQEFFDAEEGLGTLVVRYVPGGAITPAGFITKSLIYPN